MLRSITRCLQTLVGARNWGRYEGSVQTEWDETGRVMSLLSDFAYVDPQGIRWHARKGSVIDGASIPRALWSVIGSPFTGRYRAASVIHDVACDEKTRPWEDVHRCFYHAMRCSGVPAKQAAVMFWAVFRFGPRWQSGAITRSLLPQWTPAPLREDQATAIEQFFASHDVPDDPLSVERIPEREVWA